MTRDLIAERETIEASRRQREAYRRLISDVMLGLDEQPERDDDCYDGEPTWKWGVAPTTRPY